LLIPAGMTGADILHPILVRAGDRWAYSKLEPEQSFHCKSEETKLFSLKLD
jgi:hypothetical protein